jgi:DnaJ-class molecular chaperone
MEQRDAPGTPPADSAEKTREDARARYDCPECEGRGEVDGEDCLNCGGTGKAISEFS